MCKTELTHVSGPSLIFKLGREMGKVATDFFPEHHQCFVCLFFVTVASAQSCVKSTFELTLFQN